MLAKLKTYGFSQDAFFNSNEELVKKSKVIIKNSTRRTKTAFLGDPQISIDGPLRFNTFKNDLVLFIQYKILGNYADDILYRSIIKSQFNHCPIIWMFCSRQSNNSINKLQV